jgi:hypothetical protein
VSPWGINLFFEQYQGLEDPREDYIQTRGGYKFTKRALTILALKNLISDFFCRKHPIRR